MSAKPKKSKKLTVAVVGVGQIGSATALALHRAGRYRVLAVDKVAEARARMKAEGLAVFADAADAARQAELVILAVKPKNAVETLRSMAPALQGKTVISIVAAITIEVLRTAAPGAEFVRAMPNIALLVQASYTGYAMAEGVSARTRKLAEQVLGELGEAAVVEENLLDAVTGLSGSGPAYAAIFIEAMAYAGLKVGLPRDVALRSAAQTMLGSARMILDAHIHPAQLKEMVVTPAGTTIQGIYHIEESGIRSSVMRAVDAATSRCTEITAALTKG
ncbi:MAG: pyrroline-5-carboxylate reductase [Pseudomonadota bacterium]